MIDRYEEAVRDLIHRYPSAHTHRKEHQPQLPPLSARSNRTTNLITPIQIPVVIHHHQQQQRPLQQSHRPEPRSSSPMQQDNEEQGSLPPPSSI